MFVRSNSIDNVDISLGWTLSLRFKLQPHNCFCEFQVLLFILSVDKKNIHVLHFFSFKPNGLNNQCFT